MRKAYLARLGVEPEPPSVAALVRLHRAHVERVAYETLWIQLGEHWSIDVAESMQRVVERRRGGYCFHLNGAFGGLLRELGYNVTRHVGGVHGPGGATEADMANHLVLMVHELPDATSPEGEWYVDVGLGDALHEPLPLVPGEYEQGPFHVVLDATPGGVGDWHLSHDPAGAFTGMAWRSASAPVGAFDEHHTRLSTSPDSGFVKYLVVQRRDATGVDVLRGLTLRRIGAGASSSIVTTPRELFDALADVFGLDVSSIGRDAREALWRRVHAAHEAWKADAHS